jgi:hypothetical protein
MFPSAKEKLTGTHHGGYMWSVTPEITATYDCAGAWSIIHGGGSVNTAGEVCKSEVQPSSSRRHPRQSQLRSSNRQTHHLRSWLQHTQTHWYGCNLQSCFPLLPVITAFFGATRTCVRSHEHCLCDLRIKDRPILCTHSQLPLCILVQWGCNTLVARC